MTGRIIFAASMRLKRRNKLLYQLLRWRKRHIPDRNYMMIISVFIGLASGLAAVVIKNLVHFIKNMLTGHFHIQLDNFLYIAYPVIGIILTVLFIRFILRQYVGDGVPSVLYAISKNNAILKAHNMFSSIISSSLTVGFGGSVGLEGPTVATGAAIGSNAGRFLGLNYRQLAHLLAFASAGAMSAIFKSPIAAIVFAVEVIMLDLTLASLVPLLITSVTAALTSFLFLGMDVLYPFEITEKFRIEDLHFYLMLGVVCGLTSLYFTRIFMFFQNIFGKIGKWYTRLFFGGALLGLLIFLFPSLYGEGYEATNACLHGETYTIFDSSPFYFLKENLTAVMGLMFIIILMKVIATSLTFGAGGIGGIFAPTLFTGAHTGLLFALFVNSTGIAVLSPTNFALIAMGGLIAGVIHAPLTGVFLIAEITGGYELFMPLMIVSIISYITIRIFTPNSVYTIQLAKRGELLTHHKDKNVLTMMRIDKLLETNFASIHVDAKLKDLVKIISTSSRNIFPVIDEEENFAGIILLDAVRHIMFKPELYESVNVSQLMVVPVYIIDPKDTVEEIAQKFQDSGKYNLPVIEDGKYKGFISRANLFSEYRRLLREFSDD